MIRSLRVLAEFELPWNRNNLLTSVDSYNITQWPGIKLSKGYPLGVTWLDVKCFAPPSHMTSIIHDKQGWPIEIAGCPAQIPPRKTSDIQPHIYLIRLHFLRYSINFQNYPFISQYHFFQHLLLNFLVLFHNYLFRFKEFYQHT